MLRDATAPVAIQAIAKSYHPSVCCYIYAAATINAAIDAKAYECLTLGACLKTVLKGSQ